MNTEPSCPTCGAPMLVRNGKYGAFYYCKNSTIASKHGTMSVRAWEMLCRLLRTAPSRDQESPSAFSQFDFEFEVRRQMASYGVIPTDLELFAEGELHDLNGGEIDYSDEPDHWSNFRPY